MAIKVKHIESGEKYILLGTGFGVYKAKPSYFGENLFNVENQGQEQIPVASVCDKEGKILWFSTGDLKVVEIDGQKLEEFDDIDTYRE